jgi:hypothetical protein
MQQLNNHCFFKPSNAMLKPSIALYTYIFHAFIIIPFFLVIKFHITLLSLQLSNRILFIPHLRVFAIGISVVGKNHYMAIFKYNPSILAIANGASEDKHSKSIEDFLFDQTSQGTSTVGGRVSSRAQVIFDVWGVRFFRLRTDVVEFLRGGRRRYCGSLS